MKTAITPYLTFSGRAEEAIDFYQKALGAVVEMKMLFKESPDAPPPGMLQPGFENKVMHCSLRIHGALLMLSDGCNDKVPDHSGCTLALHLPTEKDVKVAYAALADGGVQSMPPCKTFWSECFGMLKDRFGISWMVSVAA